MSRIVVERGMDGFERGRQPGKRPAGTTRKPDDCNFDNNAQFRPGNHLLGEIGTGTDYVMHGLLRERLALAVVWLTADQLRIRNGRSCTSNVTAFGRPIGKFQRLALVTP